MPGGRPSTYTLDLADKLCERIASPMSLGKACSSEDMPAMSTVFKWLRAHPEFVEKYARATDERTEAQAEEMLDIADDGRNDYMSTLGDDAGAAYRLNGEHINRSRLRVDTRKWIMAKMKPKKYGDKTTTEHTGDPSNPMEVVHRIERLIVKAPNPNG